MLWLFEEKGGMPLGWWWLCWIGYIENDKGIEMLSVSVMGVGDSLHKDGEDSVGAWV